MARFQTYVGNFDGLRVGVFGMPAWARLVLAIAALPGLVLLFIAALALVLSVAVLLVCTVPVFMLLNKLLSRPQREETSPVKRVESVVIDPPPDS
jgi:hypothetical protein